MTVVTSLVAQLGFRVNQSSLTGAIGAINSLQTGMGGLVTSFTGINSLVANFINALSKITVDFASMAVSSEKISKTSGIAISELEAFKRALGDSLIPIEEVDGHINKWTKSIRDAGMGLGDLPQQAHLIGVEFRKANGELKNTKEFLIDAFNVISKSNDSEQGKIARFGMLFEGRGRELLDFTKNGTAGIDEAITKHMGLGRQIEKNAESARELSKAWIDVKTSFEKVSANMAEQLIPKLTTVFNIVSAFFDMYAKVQEYFKPLNQENSNLWKNAWNEGFDIKNNFRGSLTPSTANQPITITNNINIDVAAGTPDEQKASLESQARNAASFFSEPIIREIQTQAPFTE